MSSFDYHYHVSSKYDGSDVIDTLRSSSDSTKAEAIDWLIDNGFLHSDEQYNAAYVLALGDAIGISDEEYDAEDTDSMMSWQLGITPIPSGEEVQVDSTGDGEYDTSFTFYDWSLEQLREMAEKSPGWYSHGEEYLEYYDTTPDWPEPISYREWLIRRVQEAGKDYGTRRQGAGPNWPPHGKTNPYGKEFSPHPHVSQSDRRYGKDAEDDKPVGNPKRLGKGVDWRPHEDNFLPSQHDRMRAEYARGYSYERPLILKVAGIGLLTAFALGLLRMDSKEDTTSNE